MISSSSESFICVNEHELQLQVIWHETEKHTKVCGSACTEQSPGLIMIFGRFKDRAIICPLIFTGLYTRRSIMKRFVRGRAEHGTVSLLSGEQATEQRPCSLVFLCFVFLSFISWYTLIQMFPQWDDIGRALVPDDDPSLKLSSYKRSLVSACVSRSRS